MKKTISLNEKEKIIVVLGNVHIKKVVNQKKKKTINIEKKEKNIYINCEQKISAWHAKFTIEHKINKSPC